MGSGHAVQTEMYYIVPNTCVELTATTSCLQETCSLLVQQLEASLKNESRYLATATQPKIQLDLVGKFWEFLGFIHSISLRSQWVDMNIFISIWIAFKVEMFESCHFKWYCKKALNEVQKKTSCGIKKKKKINSISFVMTNTWRKVWTLTSISKSLSE